MLIRHGEKPGDPTIDGDNEPDLSVIGAARAAALPSLFLPAARPVECALFSTRNCFAGAYSMIARSEVETSTITQSENKTGFLTPDFLFATKDSSGSSRPRQTIAPTAAALGLSINAYYGNDQNNIQALVNALMTQQYAGKIVLICWHHGTIDVLAAKLGGKGAKKWDGHVFDRMWRIDYTGGRDIQQYGQKLLFGDETSVPPVPW
jgi:broad specificity phosphatase PhoE